MVSKEPTKPEFGNADAFLNQSRQNLNESINSLDSDIKDKLYLARRKAMAAHYNSSPQTSLSTKWKKYLPLTSIALTASIVLGIFIQSGLWQSDDVNLTVELELVSTLENIELYDDLEFYQWLAEEELQAG